MVNRLDGLWHDTIIGRHDDHRDIGDLGAAGAHRRERLVARCIEEGDLAPIDLDLIGADVLGDAARLTRRHLRIADGVEQRGLAVVNVAHDGHHRRAQNPPDLVGMPARADLALPLAGR